MENIKRRIENGEDNYTASINGAKQITFVVIATTIVLVSVFLPLSFMGGKTGRLFIEFGVVLIICCNYFKFCCTNINSHDVFKNT